MLRSMSQLNSVQFIVSGKVSKRHTDGSGVNGEHFAEFQFSTVINELTVGAAALPSLPVCTCNVNLLSKTRAFNT